MTECQQTINPSRPFGDGNDAEISVVNDRDGGVSMLLIYKHSLD